MVVAAPAGSSHRITRTPEGKVVIHDLELFVGHIPAVDGDNFTKWTEDEVDRVYKATVHRMSLGQRPKLILGHNDKERKGAPAYGDIIALSKRRISGGPGLAGDVEMSAADFDQFVASNRYPRRSVEIWKDGCMSEVALIGSETPARPLPDTRFERDDTPDRFTRALPELRMEYAMSTTDTDATIAQLRSENEELKKKLKAAQEGEGKDTHTREQFRRMSELEGEVERMRKERDSDQETIKNLRTGIQREKFSRDLDMLYQRGYAVGADGSDERKLILDRIVLSPKPEDELAFVQRFVKQDPLNRQPITETRVEDGSKVSDTQAAAQAEQFVKEQQAAGKETRGLFKVAFERAKRGEPLAA